MLLRNKTCLYFYYPREICLKIGPRKEMAVSASQLCLPQSSDSPTGDEAEDYIPHSLFVCNSRDAINFNIVYHPNDLKPSGLRSFKPDLVFQIFGESGIIFGYRNLSINIYIMANSANCFVELKYKAVFNSTNGPLPDDILKKLSPWLPAKYYTNKKEFASAISHEDHTKIFGKIIDKFETRNELEGTSYKYIITQCSSSEPGFAEFHYRFECLIVWYIDAASQIDVHDPNWMFLYVYEKRLMRNGRDYGYYPIGFCTVYKFFHFPDKVRTRIAQVFIIPPCQRTGIGIRLLSAAYKMIHELPNVIDIAVEDPCDAFTRMRDTLDCQLLMQLQSFRHPVINKGFTTQMFNEANAHFKFNKRQCRRAYEILRMTYACMRNDNTAYQRLYRDIKAYIEAPYKREREAVRRKRMIIFRRLSQDDCFVYEPPDRSREITHNADVHFQEIKVSAHHLQKKMEKDWAVKMATSEQNKRQLILSIIHFLQKEADQSAPDKKESIEVAVQCLESAFGVEYNHESPSREEIQDLLTVFSRTIPPENVVAEAEESKNKGNELMRGGMYPEAIQQYTRAINLNPNNAVYFCNRAAAYSRLENHENAIADCEEAVRLDPNYAKAYGRLGIAYSSLNRFREARDSYTKALIADPGNSMYEENLKLAEERMVGNPIDPELPADPANVDLTQFMNNPNLLNMASQMLNDPGVRNVMSGILHMGNEGNNPNIDALLQMGQQLAQQMQINNPSFVDNLRRQFSGDNPDDIEPGNAGSDRRDEPPGPNRDGGNAPAQ